MVEQTLFVIFKRGLGALRVLFLFVGAEKITQSFCSRKDSTTNLNLNSGGGNYGPSVKVLQCHLAKTPVFNYPCHSEQPHRLEVYITRVTF